MNNVRLVAPSSDGSKLELLAPFEEERIDLSSGETSLFQCIGIRSRKKPRLDKALPTKSPKKSVCLPSWPLEVFKLSFSCDLKCDKCKETF